MRKIIASLDLGSNAIKLIVGEIQKSKLNVLACVDIKSQGIKQGYIVNPESALLALRDAFKKCEEMLGIPVKKVLVSVPSYNLNCFMTEGSIMIKSEDKLIKHDHIIKAMQKSVYKKIDDNKELVSILPTKFIINDDEQVKSPVGMVANKITVNAVAVVIPKKNTEAILKCLEKLQIEVTDICVSPLADFYEFKKSEYNTKVGAVVNVGQSNTIVSIFNKGVLTSSEIIDIGSSSIDNDIAYVFKIPKTDAVYLKEQLVVCDIHSALPSESVMVKDISGSEIKINQYDVSAVAISRIQELLNLVKKQINLLTKKQISYIIVTGGISELAYFNRYLEEMFGGIARVGEITEIGARSNKYSTALGMIKYYNSRLKLRDVDYSIFSMDELEELSGTHKKVEFSENSLLGKIYGYFFDN